MFQYSSPTLFHLAMHFVQEIVFFFVGSKVTKFVDTHMWRNVLKM